MLSCADPAKKGETASYNRHEDAAESRLLSFDSLTVEKFFYISADSTRPLLKLKLHFTYPATYTSDSALVGLQRLFVEAFAGKELAGRSPKGAFEALEKSALDDVREMETDSDLSNWFNEDNYCYRSVETTVFDSCGAILTLQTTDEAYYVGAAHGSYNIKYTNIDLKENKLLTEADLFKPGTEEKLSALILNGLRNKYGDGLDNLLLDRDDVRPNGNFYISKGELVYVYNEYEIAAYAVGVVEAPIPLEKVKKLMKREIE
jgi:hypothetical protein